MSQYGALGFANEGRGFAEILAHFYPGTTLGAAPVARVRVLLQEQRPAVTISSPVPFRVRDVFGKTSQLAGRRRTSSARSSSCPSTAFRRRSPGRSSCCLGTRPLQVGALAAGEAYRGQLVVSVTGQRLSVVNDVGLEQYLAGVVPKEMPAAWHPEALKAQAVAARSYALAHRVTGKAFDLYADVRSQVYGGVKAEDQRTTAAIDATAGQVLLYAGRIADTLFHSTSGGRTIAAVEAFGKDVPYLVAVDDPHSALSPVHRWGPVPVVDAAARKGLGLTSSILGLRLAREPSGRVRTATITTAAGETTVTGTTLRRGLGLRSTWVTAVSSLTLTRPGTPAVYGRPVVLTGEVRGAKRVVLSQRIDGVWQQVLARAVRRPLHVQHEAPRPDELPARGRHADGTCPEAAGRPARARHARARRARRHRRPARSRHGGRRPAARGRVVDLCGPGPRRRQRVPSVPSSSCRRAPTGPGSLRPAGTRRA